MSTVCIWCSLEGAHSHCMVECPQCKGTKVLPQGTGYQLEQISVKCPTCFGHGITTYERASKFMNSIGYIQVTEWRKVE